MYGGQSQFFASNSPSIMPFVGAVLILSTLVIGPITQQTLAIDIQISRLVNETATIPIARAYLQTGNQVPTYDSPILSALYGSQQESITPPFNCPTGNCTFPNAYTSLAVCHTCEEMEPQKTCYEYTNQGDTYVSCNATLPNGHTLYNGGRTFGEVVNFLTHPRSMTSTV